MKDVRGLAGTRLDGRKEGWTDGWTNAHGRTRVISIVPLRLRRVTINIKSRILNTNGQTGISKSTSTLSARQLGRAVQFSGQICFMCCSRSVLYKLCQTKWKCKFMVVVKLGMIKHLARFIKSHIYFDFNKFRLNDHWILFKARCKANGLLLKKSS